MREASAERESQNKMKDVETITTAEAAAVAERGAHVAPEQAFLKEGATQKKGASGGQKTASGGKSRGARPKTAGKARRKAGKLARANEVSKPRAESKGGKILELMGRAKGASLAEIMKETDWQAHSVRGFISTAAKKHRIRIESAKNEAGDRVYKIAK
jgi:hypothetical protein